MSEPTTILVAQQVHFVRLISPNTHVLCCHLCLHQLHISKFLSTHGSLPAGSEQFLNMFVLFY